MLKDLLEEDILMFEEKPDSPEKKLQRAILERAILDYKQPESNPCYRCLPTFKDRDSFKKKIFREARNFFISKNQGEFSFNGICESLGISKSLVFEVLRSDKPINYQTLYD